jgi:ferric iron reductase protein FhuF
MTSLSVDKNSVHLTVVSSELLLSFHSQYYSELMTVEYTEFLSTDREVMLLSFHSQYYLELTTAKCTMTSLPVDKNSVHSTVISSE